MNIRRWAPLLALLLLAGCQAPAVDSSAPDLSPEPSGSSQVTVHWDALERREPLTTLAQRLDDGPLPELVPADGYGAIVPYIGEEQQRVYRWEDENGETVEYSTSYLYGLCTTDGLILTDPVYLSVFPASCYHYDTGASSPLPAWVMTQTVQAEDGSPYTAVGLAADDGSWSTGMRFRSGTTSTISASEYSVLMMERDDSAVLISLEDGRELARYSPYDFLSEEDSDYAQWFFSDGLSWGLLRCVDRYFCYDPQWAGMTGDTVWIDAVTGEILEEAPMEFPEERAYIGDEYFFSSGWYERDSDPLLVHYNDGTTESIELPDGLGELNDITKDYLVFVRFSEDNSSPVYTLTDHSGRTLYATEPSDNTWMGFLIDRQTGRRYPYVCQYNGSYDWGYQLLDSEGRPILAACDWGSLSGGLLPIVDDSYYRLVDLDHGCQDLIRLPRWSALDLPADD